MSHSSLANRLAAGTYEAYAYSYPHKTAYRPLEPAVALRDAWAEEERDALFLYLHLPFCEMRCGFCNLFTAVEHEETVHERYLAVLERQARVVREALGTAKFARMAVGGGTPTILSPRHLHRLFDLAAKIGASLNQIQISVETSPATAARDRLRVLRERGVTRVSMGVQSFVEAEVHAVGRAQKLEQVNRALEALRAADFPVLNLDLMYGLPGQTRESWSFSLASALAADPEEIYLYPLYVRPLTGLGVRAAKGRLLAAGQEPLALYRAGRDFLLANGYRQVSMRMFQKVEMKSLSGPVYCCQNDGMVGLGSGARSYTRDLHYSSEYAVGASGVREILGNYLVRDDAAFAVADYGFRLNPEEQRRRFLMQSLLQIEGLSDVLYRERFGRAPLDDFPELAELEELGLAEHDGATLRLNARGFECSDVIGPWLTSPGVEERMRAFALR